MDVVSVIVHEGQTDEFTILENRLAVNKKVKNRKGDVIEKVVYIAFKSRGKTADNISRYCKKGDLILLTGEWDQDQWEDPSTKTNRQKDYLSVSRIQFLGGRNDG